MPRISATDRVVTRTRLIEAAKREFAARGLAGARFDEISLAAGLAKGTIYNYFASKEELFFTIVEQWCALISDRFSASSGRSASEELVTLAQIDVGLADRDHDLAVVVMQQMPALTGSHADRAVEAITPALGLIEAVLRRGLETGEFTSAHQPGALARLYLGVLSALEIEALLPGGTIALDDVPELMLHHFVKGLRP